ncbi:MAG TPA: tetratricopeptide repeat protein [Candidatus Eisenbacteria bacterium]|nr:tetratricopeptide repeat protein [Candidatus Eisenbacteria bacterium]
MRWFSRIVVAWLASLTVVTVSAQSGRDELTAIMAALRASRFGEALQMLEPALRQSPANPQLWTLQGLAYSGDGHKKEALVSFHKALKISPNYLPALEGAAQIEYDEGSSEASVLLQRVLKVAPEDPTANAMLASLAYKSRNCPEAVSHFEKSGSLLQSEPAAQRQYGMCLAKMKRYDAAITTFQKLVEKPGDDRDDRLRLASLQMSSGKPADAIDTLQPALQDHPEAAVLALAAEAYEQQKNTPEAVKLLHQAIVENPKDVDLYLQFADVSFVHQSFQVGVDMMSAGLKLQPDAAALYLARGVLYVQLADYDHAENDFEKAEELDPQLSVSDAARGMIAQQKDDLDKALAVVRARLSKKPDDAFLLYVQADILVQKNPDVGSPEFNQAIASAQKAVKIQPGLVAARDTLAKLYQQEGKDQLAVVQSRESLRHDPNDQVALYHLIVGLRRTGQKQELPELLQRLAELRQKATREEGEHNRYKLIEQTNASAPSK